MEWQEKRKAQINLKCASPPDRKILDSNMWESEKDIKLLDLSSLIQYQISSYHVLIPEIQNIKKIKKQWERRLPQN